MVKYLKNNIMEKVYVCNEHNRLISLARGEWMKLNDIFRDYLFNRHKDLFEEVEIPCDKCLKIANDFFIH